MQVQLNDLAVTSYFLKIFNKTHSFGKIISNFQTWQSSSRLEYLQRI